jgi:RimJ/RimL family protein N-acetyltransferase
MTELREASDAFEYGDRLLIGTSVRLRGVREDDLPVLARWLMDPAIQSTQSSWVVPQSEAATKEKIAQWSGNQRDDVGFAIETLDDPPVLVGHVGMWGARPKDRCATIGIGLGREFVGMGYGSDAVRVIVDYAFREAGLHRVQLDVVAFNTAGTRAYRKVGFVEEGRRRQAVFHDGRWYDQVLMGVLEDEWRASSSVATG